MKKIHCLFLSILLPFGGIAQPVQITVGAGYHTNPNWSAVDDFIAYDSDYSGNPDIWIIPSSGGNPTQITMHSGNDFAPTVSPDGTIIAFHSDRTGSVDIWTKDISTGELIQVTTHGANDFRPMWSPDGIYLAFNRGSLGYRDIFIYNIFSGNTMQFTTDPNDDGTATWSPDGTNIAFHSDRSGQYQIYSQAFSITSRQELEKHTPALQIYPNPSNSTVTIKYNLESTGHMKLFITDVSGKKIRSMVDGEQPKGTHEFIWDRTDKSGKLVSDGIYFLMIQTGQKVYSQQITLIKRGCSIFTCQVGDKVYFCGNLDHPNPEGYIRFVPASEDGYGGMLHGYLAKAGDQSWISFEGGMNEKGLSFDTNGLPDNDMKPHSEKRFSWGQDNFWNLLLRRCANVNDAIELSKDFNFGEMMDFQVQVADISGDAVVISPGPDGELRFTRKPEKEKFLISTNFNNANPEHRHGTYPCKRYVKMNMILKEIKSEENMNINNLASILDSVHFEGASYNTIYSYICDLKKGMFYVFYFHQYGEVVSFDLEKELSSGDHTIKVEDMVSHKTRDCAAEEYQIYKSAKAKQ